LKTINNSRRNLNMTNQEFEQIKIIAEKKLFFNEDNFQGKLSEVPLIYDTFLKLFIKEHKVLQNMKLKKDIKYADLYRNLKFNSDIRLENKHEIENQMFSDISYQKIVSDINDQQEIVTFLEQTLENVKNLSFAIRNYIDWRKFLEAER